MYVYTVFVSILGMIDRRSQTLPLFEELSNPAAIHEPDKHLRAAQRLAKTMGRLPDRSAQQLKTGRAICHHLIALLEADHPGPANAGSSISRTVRPADRKKH